MRAALLEARNLLTDLECTQATASWLGLPLAAAASGRPWTEELARTQFVSELELEHTLPPLVEFHTTVAGRMAAHLQLVSENLKSSLWLAGAVLSTDPAAAKEAAAELVEHLDTTPAHRRTSFENMLFDDANLWDALQDFSNVDPPTVLWGARGLFAPLYRFLAPRFLANPDHVLDCERQHAVWKWVLQRRRAMRLPNLNAWLKVGEHIRRYDELPPYAELQPHIDEVRLSWKRSYLE